MNFTESALVSLGQDELINRGQDFAGEHFQPTKDPFYETEPDGKKHRRKMPDYVAKEESKNWKSIQNKAWLHDKGLCGCCCWAENIGWAPFLAIFPIIGPALMYSVHSKLIKLADKKYNLPPEMKVKMYSNIAIDLCISLVPILGSVFAWLNACSTRNAAMIYNFVCERALEKHNNELRAQQLRQDAVANKIQNRKIMKEKSTMKSGEVINDPKVNVPERAKTKVNIQQRDVSSTSINDRRHKENRQPYNNNYNTQRTPYPTETPNQNNNRNNNVLTNRVAYSQPQQYNNARYQQHPQQQYSQYQRNQYQQQTQYQQQNSYPQTQYQQNQYIPMQNMQAPQRSYHPQG
ncbi:hypothetical protein C6P45_000241 [Maudiozyma exigua]|uniref:Uncharacterized protein n=1 Tax=Maudiozyma exigua TaxID=34358 RepID=A0A9P7B8K3_MAUEX|nr:hypothetical protein C6P45_000241 [Kazachstania exigua]